MEKTGRQGQIDRQGQCDSQRQKTEVEIQTEGGETVRKQTDAEDDKSRQEREVRGVT